MRFIIVLMFAALASCAPAVHFSPDAKAQSERAKPIAIAMTRVKPGAGDDSCEWANDRECDEPDIGTGACPGGTDRSDCRFLRGGETDSCRWARDGECDEPRFGTGACVMGSDRTDCGDLTRLRFRDDSCVRAFNGICDERAERGTGLCRDRTDRSDCVGRERPLSIHDHYFGHDDRVRVDTSQAPWAQIGQLRLPDDEFCTATLVAENVVITAAHCIATETGFVTQGEFVSAAPATVAAERRAQIIAYLTDPAFSYRRFNASNDVDGRDWALLRLDRPLGRALGFIGVRDALGPPGPGGAQRPALYQAGFGWDTGDYLAANIGCRIVQVFADGAFAHDCDTTQGDSGSALIVRDGEQYAVVGVDSNFRPNPDNPTQGAFLYMAASAAPAASLIEDFSAGRIGRPMTPPPRRTRK